MAKLIVLRLTGNLHQQGYSATLEISEEGQRPYAEEMGQLPPHAVLAEKITHHWHDKYRTLVAPYRRYAKSVSQITDSSESGLKPRIKPKKISYDGSVNARLRDCHQSARDLQTVFLQWLDSQGFRAIDKCLRTYLNPGDVSRFLIRADDPQLQKLPWHAWDVFKTFETEPTFGAPRFQPTAIAPPPANKQSVKILAILGHSDGIDVAADEALLKTLAPATCFLVEPTREEITDHLWAEHWDIIFFAGHSETEGDTGKIYLNADDYLTIDEVWYGLRKAVENGLQVAIFNSCDGLGLAHQLMNDFQIPHLIVMRELVPDQVAQTFLKHFLSAFAGGRPFHLAVREARERLQALEGQFPCASWLPVVYQNPWDGALQWQDLCAPESTSPESTSLTAAPSQAIPVAPPPRAQAGSDERLPIWRQVQRVVATGLLVTGIVGGLRWSGILEPVELLAFDHLMRLRPVEPLDPTILIVEATPAEAELIEEYGYPIPDSTLAALLATLRGAEPVAIGLLSQRRQQRGSDRDRAQLIHEFTVNPDLVTMCSANPETDELHGAPEELTLEQQQQQVGFGDFYPDYLWPGETVRRLILQYTPNALQQASPCIANSSLSLHLGYRLLQAQGIQGTLNDQDHLQFDDVTLQPLPRRFGGYQSLDGSNQIMINYLNTGQAPAMTVTVQDVMEGRVKPSLIRDRLVIIGTNNPNVVEYINTPYGEMPPLHIKAHMVSSLIQQVRGQRPAIWALPQWADGLIIVGSTLVAGAIALWGRSRWRLGIMTGLCLVGWHQICGYGLIHGAWLPLVPVVMASLISLWGVKLVTSRTATQSPTSSSKQ